MAVRLLDAVVASAALILCAPALLLAAIGVRLSGPGPIFYRACRVGRHGRLFDMYKFRTMRVRPGTGPAITAQHDRRVFAFGALLRKLKIDELPQFVNVLRGDMSIVGPRPEDPVIVRDSYTAEARQTLSVLPGLLSPGSVYYYTHLEQRLDKEDPTRVYSEEVLPIKIALDRVYIRDADVLYNLRLIVRAVWVVAAKTCGKSRFADPPELAKARSLGFWNGS
jgi:lipopolysaccharide/colanic/teichoic acid biosynthesis glycosyltransferase